MHLFEQLRRLGLCCVLLIAGLSSGASAGTLTDQLIGTWKLELYENYDAKGHVTYLYGEHPAGYFVYDPTGHLSVQIMRTPPLPPFASGDDKKGTDAEVIAAFNDYVAYFGTYRVDEQKHVVTHIVEGSLQPKFTGTEQPRPFRLEGDVLIIELSTPDGVRYFRQLRRVR